MRANLPPSDRRRLTVLFGPAYRWMSHTTKTRRCIVDMNLRIGHPTSVFPRLRHDVGISRPVRNVGISYTRDRLENIEATKTQLDQSVTPKRPGWHESCERDCSNGLTGRRPGPKAVLITRGTYKHGENR